MYTQMTTGLSPDIVDFGSGQILVRDPKNILVRPQPKGHEASRLSCVRIHGGPRSPLIFTTCELL